MMKRLVKYIFELVSIACFIGFTVTSFAASPQKGQLNWDSVVAAAKKEKTALVYIGSTGSVLRQPLTDAFKQKYDIDLQFVVGRGAAIAEKIFQERNAGLYLGDAVFQGSTVQLLIFKPQNALIPLDSLLINPEIVNPKVWLGERFPYLDKDHTVIYFFAIRQNYMARNTSLVGEREVKSFNDLLQPKWKGQMIIHDPTMAGSGSGWYSWVHSLIGKEKTNEFMRQIVKLEPMITRDDRLLIEGIARGKYKFAFGYSEAPFISFKRSGAPIDIMKTTDVNYVSSGGGDISLLKNAPHPNAAIVFMNWLLTREAQTIISKATGLPSARTDVPTTGLEQGNVLTQGEKFYLELEDDILAKDKLMVEAKDIFAPLLK